MAPREFNFERVYLLETRLKDAFKDPVASAKASDPEIIRICRFAAGKAAGKYRPFSSKTGLEADDYFNIALSFAVLFFHRYAGKLSGKKATHNALLRFLGQKLHRTMVRFSNKTGRVGVNYDEKAVVSAVQEDPEQSLDDAIEEQVHKIGLKGRKKVFKRVHNVLARKITEDFSIRNLALETLYPVGGHLAKYEKNIYFAALNTITGLGKLLNVELAAAQTIYNQGSQGGSEAHYERVKSIMADITRIVEEVDNENAAKAAALGLPSADLVTLLKN